MILFESYGDKIIFDYIKGDAVFGHIETKSGEKSQIQQVDSFVKFGYWTEVTPLEKVFESTK